MIRSDEGDLGSSRRPLAKLPEEEGETGAQALSVLLADALHNFPGKLLAQQASAVERIPDRGANRLHLVASDRRVQNTGRIPPVGQLAGRAGDGSPRRMPQRQLVCRVQVESPA